MKHAPISRLAPLAAAACLLAVSTAATAQGTSSEPKAGLDALNERINEQVRRLAEIRAALEREEANLQQMRRTVAERMLAEQRGGQSPATATTPPPPVTTAQARPPLDNLPDDVTISPAGSAVPTSEGRAPPVVPIFDEPMVLTTKGTYVFEPSAQYSYATNNRVALLGFTVIPAVLVGLVDVREVQRKTTVAAFTGRVGVANSWELEARVPYVYRADTTRSREIGTGSSVDKTIDATGSHLGDIELAARYQLPRPTADWPFMIAGLRFKTRTGTDPFEVTTDCVMRCVGNTTGTGQPLKLPTGSGFFSLQPSLTWLFQSDPAVVFGSFSYLHSFSRNNVYRRVLDGEQEAIGKIAPGDVFGANVGIGIALNDKSSFSFGYDHAYIRKTKQNGESVPGTLSSQLGTALFGYTYRLSNRTALTFTVGAGLTNDTPDVTLGFRMPWTF